MDNKKQFKWRTQDWIWLLIVLIYAQGFAFLYNNYLMQVISYVSTFVSIALAGIAIYISIKEATNNDKMKNEIYILLNEVRSKIGDIDTKMVTQNDIEKIITSEVIGIKKPLMSDLVEVIEQTKGDNSNLEELINEKVDNNIEKLISNINVVQKEYMQDNLTSTIVVRNTFVDTIETYEIDEVFSFDDFWNRLVNMSNKYEPKKTTKEKMSKFVEAGYLARVGSEYKRVL